MGIKSEPEMKRAEFKEEIGRYKPEEIVYIDEAGMDNREGYSYGWNAHRSALLCSKKRLKARTD
jgi:hypothetical protein